jgi:hypothetical protein
MGCQVPRVEIQLSVRWSQLVVLLAEEVRVTTIHQPTYMGRA